MTWLNWIEVAAAGMAVAGYVWSRVRSRAFRRELGKLRQAEEHYRAFFDQSPKPMYVFDLEDLTFLNVNEAALRHYGYSREEFLSLTADKLRPHSELALMLQRTSTGTQTPCTTRHQKKDGTLIDVEVSVQHLSIANRTVVLVSVNDITAQKEADQHLKQAIKDLQQTESDLRQLGMVGEMLQSCHTSLEAFSMVSELLPQIFVDYSGCIYALKPSRDLVESVATWGDHPANANFFVPDDCWALRRGRTHLFEDGKGPRCRHTDEDQLTTLCIPMIAQSDAMGVLHLVPKSGAGEQRTSSIPRHLQNVAKAAAEQIALALSNIRFREALRHQSIRDPLTTLFNRRYMEESLERELHRAMRNQSYVGIVMIDVDHFKQFNDSYGHRTADKMLCLLGKYLQSAVTLDDIVCRYGGEEFVLILPSASLDELLDRISQLQAGARQLRLDTDSGMSGFLTVSAGIAVFPVHGVDSETLISLADRALYDAKHAGRDRVAIAPGVQVG